MVTSFPCSFSDVSSIFTYVIRRHGFIFQKIDSPLTGMWSSTLVMAIRVIFSMAAVFTLHKFKRRSVKKLTTIELAYATFMQRLYEVAASTTIMQKIIIIFRSIYLCRL